ncbi:MAG: endonuclease/exonuclease/phosphatase family protein [Flavobacteriales bacterium]
MAKKPASATKSKPKARKPAPKKPAKKASPEKPAVKARKWDSATLLVLPGLVLVIVGEVAARVSPAWVPWLAPAGYVYGLAYPLLAVGTVWRLTSFRWLQSLAPLVVLLLTWPSFSLVFSVGLSKPDVALSEDSFEVTTFNVRRLDEFEWLDGDQTRQDIATWLAEQPDGIWCFQEFPKRGKATLRSAGFSWLKPRRRLFTWPREAGPALASSYPVKDWTTYMFEDEDAGQGRVLQADVETPAGLVRVFNVHLQSLHFDHADYDAVEEGPSREQGARLWGLITYASKARALQAQELVRRMEESPYPVIVAGDFNDTPMSYAMHALRGSRAEDTFAAASFGPGGTHLGAIPGLRIDGILADTTLQCVSHRTHGVVMSDHRPVTAVLQAQK